jgi:hypothetical protein
MLCVLRVLCVVCGDSSVISSHTHAYVLPSSSVPSPQPPRPPVLPSSLYLETYIWKPISGNLYLERWKWREFSAVIRHGRNR